MESQENQSNNEHPPEDDERNDPLESTSMNSERQRSKGQHGQAASTTNLICEPPVRGAQVQKYYSQPHSELNHTFIASLSQGYHDNDSDHNSRGNSQNHNIQQQSRLLQDESEISQGDGEIDNDDNDEEDIDNSDNDPEHVVGEILEVKLQPNLDLTLLVGNNLSVFQNGINNLQSTMFMVDWQCKCCENGKRKPQDSWMYLNELVDVYNIDSDKLRSLEQIAIRELRERETKKHAKELTKYLNFEDVEDFTQAEFEEKNFSSCSQTSNSNCGSSNKNFVNSDVAEPPSEVKTMLLDQLENRLHQCPVINKRQLLLKQNSLYQTNHEQSSSQDYHIEQQISTEDNNTQKEHNVLSQGILQECQDLKGNVGKKQSQADSWENHVTMEYQCDSRETSNNQSQKDGKAAAAAAKYLGKRGKPDGEEKNEKTEIQITNTEVISQSNSKSQKQCSL